MAFGVPWGCEGERFDHFPGSLTKVACEEVLSKRQENKKFERKAYRAHGPATSRKGGHIVLKELTQAVGNGTRRSRRQVSAVNGPNGQDLRTRIGDETFLDLSKEGGGKVPFLALDAIPIG